MSNKQYYDINPIWELNAVYSIIIGQRSNGKTYGALEKSLQLFADTGKQTAIIRRYQDDFKGKRGQSLYAPLTGVIKDLFNDEYNCVVFKSNQWFLAFDDGDDLNVCNTPFAYAFALTSMEHDKSSSYPHVSLIVYDEFLTRGYELPNEFLLFQNTVSTIVRDRQDVRILMLGNTVNQYSTYFDEMGLTNIRQQKQGTIDIYRYGETDLTVAVEYCDNITKHKKTNKYFAFDNPRLQMINKGTWEIDVYPRIPSGDESKTMYTFCIVFKENTIMGQVKIINKGMFICFTRKTTPIKENTLVYDSEAMGDDPMIIPNLFLNDSKPTMKIRELIFEKHCLYDSNYTGEIIRNWIMSQKTESKVIQ